MGVSSHSGGRRDKQPADERTLSIVKLSTALARPKSATLTIGGSSFVRRTFCVTQSIIVTSQVKILAVATTNLRLEIPMSYVFGVNVL